MVLKLKKKWVYARRKRHYNISEGMETLKNTILPYAAIGCLLIIGITRIIVEGYFWIQRTNTGLTLQSPEYARIYYHPISNEVKLFWSTFIALFILLELPVIYMNSRSANPVAVPYNKQNKVSMRYEQRGAFRQLLYINNLGKPQK